MANVELIDYHIQTIILHMYLKEPLSLLISSYVLFPLDLLLL